MNGRSSGPRGPRFAISVSGGFVLVLAALVYFNTAATLPREDAEARVRLVLERQVLQRHALSQGAMTPEKAEALARALARVKATQLRALEMGKLAPDYLLRPHRPTHVVRVEVLEPGVAPAVRYFSLPWDGIDGETGAGFWAFAL